MMHVTTALSRGEVHVDAKARKLLEIYFHLFLIFVPRFGFVSPMKEINFLEFSQGEEEGME